MGVKTTRTGKGSSLTHNELDANFDSSWSSKKIASDVVNATTTQTTISDGTNVFTYTPPANTDFEIEAELLVTTGDATTNMPLIQVDVPAGQQYGEASIQHVTSNIGLKAWVIAGFTNAAAQATTVAGTFQVAINIPLRYYITVKGRSGASPSAITIKCAAEIAAANGCIVKAGSVMRYRTVK
jgi:hypothetical protein